MPEDEAFVVADEEWCSEDEAYVAVEAARPGATRHLDWNRLIPVLDQQGRKGYYRPAVTNEVVWQANASGVTRAVRTIGRMIEWVVDAFSRS